MRRLRTTSVGVKRSRHIWLVAGSVLALIVAGVWIERRPIATGFVTRELAKRDVPARFKVAQVGPRTQRFEALSIGDPERPDLTADWAEVDLQFDWRGRVIVDAIRASGVVLRGRLADGTLTWGAVDKLLPAPSGKPFELPEIAAQLQNAVVLLATPYGNVAARVNGAGRLDSGFRGTAQTASSALRSGSCVVRQPRAYLSIRSNSARLDRVTVKGPVSAANGSCSDAEVADITGTVDASWSKGAVVTADYAVEAGSAQYQGTKARRVTVDGKVSLVDQHVETTGTAAAASIVPDVKFINSIVRAIPPATATPSAPLMTKLKGALQAAGAGLRASADYGYVNNEFGSQFNVWRARAVARSGATLDLRRDAPPPGIVPSTVATTVHASLQGGGFPDARLTAEEAAADGSWQATAYVAPYAAGTARLTLRPVKLSYARNGALQANSHATLSGPLENGRVDKLTFPIAVERSARGDVAIHRTCAPFSFAALSVAGARVGATKLILCPVGPAMLTYRDGRLAGGAKTGALAIDGRLGGSPLRLTAAGASASLGGPLQVDRLRATLGASVQATQLAVDRVTGRLGSSLGGAFDGLSGRIANVPLAVDQGKGGWRFADGRLDLTGALRVADTVPQPRFERLTSDDVRLTLHDGKIVASATLREPVSGTSITRVAIDHDLSRGSGDATLTVRNLFFGKTLQPEALTRLTVGIVANVQGGVDGVGHIRWTPDGVTSDGRFSTDNLDFAAAFGPVSGMKGAIVFDDLLALSTPPGQRATVALVNPGVEVSDGVIDYRLLPNQQVAIERGRWPFAGGELLLEPTLLDFGQERPRTMVFRVVGLDAAKFIEQLKLENIAATGTYDGSLPITFDVTGGRIEGGRIVARAGGGTLAYVGDVSNAEMNTYAKLAFDVLKSVKYRNLTIDLDGALDGEIVSQVRFTGTNEADAEPGTLAKRFDGLPFKFNITIRAPFRGLIGTARGLQDPRALLDGVQPAASETKVSPR